MAETILGSPKIGEVLMLKPCLISLSDTSPKVPFGWGHRSLCDLRSIELDPLKAGQVLALLASQLIPGSL